MAASEFYMPGYLIAPKWQADAPKWDELFSVDAAEILGVISKELTRLIGYSRVARNNSAACENKIIALEMAMRSRTNDTDLALLPSSLSCGPRHPFNAWVSSSFARKIQTSLRATAL